MYTCIEDAKSNMKRIGEMINKKKLPKEICPLIIGITGFGKVSKGAKEILDLIPHEYIDPSNLSLIFQKDARHHVDKIYITIIESQHMYIHKTKNTFDKRDFYANPKDYKSIFAPNFLPYLSLLVHGMYWDPKSENIISKEEAREFALQKKFRIFGITDITCDVGGSISLMKRLTSIDKPFYLIDPITEKIDNHIENVNDNLILYHAVDHLPAEFALDASCHFSKNLFSFMKPLAESKYPVDFEDQHEIPQEILNAEIACNGKLTPKCSYLYKELATYYPEYQEVKAKF